MSKYADVSSPLLSARDMDMLTTGRRLEREELLELMEASAKKNMKRTIDYALAVGFIIEMIKDLPDA